MNENKTYKPDWVPENASEAFATKVVKGIDPASEKSDIHNHNKSVTKKRSALSTDDYYQGILSNDRTLLGRAITLIESNAQSHRLKAQELLQKLLPHTGKSLRIGISGVPGAGKSTLVETLGCYLIEKGHKVAVLAVDPSSSVTRGSILGDKTRMEKLSRQRDCFIRPSPSGGTLGGVTRKSRETILTCEAAGYDIIMIETVGVGQNEITVRSMVDFFLLVLIPGGGDELQGIKKGVIEIADAIAINKADGQNVQRALASKSEYAHAIHYIQPATRSWVSKVITCSAQTGDGIEELWKIIQLFQKATRESGAFDDRRKHQSAEWMMTLIEDHLKVSFFSLPEIQQMLPDLRAKLLRDEILPTQAAEILIELYHEKNKNG